MRAANARLREVIEAKDTEIAALRSAHQAQVEALRVEAEALSAEVTELRARLGQNPRTRLSDLSAALRAAPRPAQPN